MEQEIKPQQVIVTPPAPGMTQMQPPAQPNFNPPVANVQQPPVQPNLNPAANPVQPQPVQPQPQPVYVQEKVQPQPQQQQTFGFTPDQFKELLTQLSLGNAGFIQKLGDLVDGVSQNTQRTFGIRKAKRMEDIDQSDILDTPAIFFAWGLMTNIRDDVRDGVNVKTPYQRPIRFKNLYRYKRGSGRDAEIVMICHAVVRSKKEAEFVRTHSKFGIRYFEVTQEAERMSSEYGVILSAVATEVSKLSQFEIMNKARALKIPIVENFSVMRRQIIEKEAQRRFQNKMSYNKMPTPLNIDKPEVVVQSPEEINKTQMFE